MTTKCHKLSSFLSAIIATLIASNFMISQSHAMPVDEAALEEVVNASPTHAAEFFTIYDGLKKVELGPQVIASSLRQAAKRLAEEDAIAKGAIPDIITQDAPPTVKKADEQSDIAWPLDILLENDLHHRDITSTDRNTGRKFVTVGDKGIAIFNRSTKKLEKIFSFGNGIEASKMEVHRRHLFVALGEAGFVVINIDTLEVHPSWNIASLAKLKIPAYDFFFADNHVFVLGGPSRKISVLDEFAFSPEGYLKFDFAPESVSVAQTRMSHKNVLVVKDHNQKNKQIAIENMKLKSFNAWNAICEGLTSHLAHLIPQHSL